MVSPLYSIVQFYVHQEDRLYCHLTGALIFVLCLLGILGTICSKKHINTAEFKPGVTVDADEYNSIEDKYFLFPLNKVA